jgi:hypothetical protein
MGVLNFRINFQVIKYLIIVFNYPPLDKLIREMNVFKWQIQYFQPYRLNGNWNLHRFQID